MICFHALIFVSFDLHFLIFVYFILAIIIFHIVLCRTCFPLKPNFPYGLFHCIIINVLLFAS
jgi:hypothetical protein